MFNKINMNLDMPEEISNLAAIIIKTTKTNTGEKRILKMRS